MRQGRPFSLAIPFDADGPQTGGIPGRDNPSLEMIAVNVAFVGYHGFTTNDEKMAMGTQAATHWDALSHVGYSGELYNGVPLHRGHRGRGRPSWASRTSARSPPAGVLLDVARLHGIDHFDDNHPITADDLDGALPPTGVIARARRHRRSSAPATCTSCASARRTATGPPAPGLSVGTIEWLHDHQVAGVATDTLVLECMPGEDPAALLPVHMIQLRDMGLAQGQIWALDELADALRRRRPVRLLPQRHPDPPHRRLGRHGRPHRRQVAATGARAQRVRVWLTVTERTRRAVSMSCGWAPPRWASASASAGA